MQQIAEFKEKILSGETSLRSLSEQTGIDREYLKMMIISKCNEEELRKLEEILADNKKNSTTLNLDKKFEKIIVSILKEEISAREASEKYGIDRETLRRKAEELVNSSPEYAKYYIKYKGRRGDYSKINFRRLVIEMIEFNMSQTEIAEIYSIPARTVSREIEKLKRSDDSRDVKLYDIAKIYADKKERHKDLTDMESHLYETILNELKKDSKFTEVNLESTKEKRLRELEQFEIQVNEMKSNGMTNEQIAKKLGIGVSTIRRRILELKEMQNLAYMKEKSVESVQKSER